ncbi:MAG: class I SAM-dependent methyltransferase [Candidatus Eisenbacteria bacterium]|uniref:Class I SAM-dependent methyltransferase n=1 Tax=Eiseniibacteriota bacterium TaxID=2212470 RepID=A0A948W5I2_UNCEI|nr:class I SAM-dependent methyltransferase [Candidatus Eisenbacteria bacterium]MBU2690025.1 class I SAM-dependent methyltransferase [Candidatus Eisenbacteria bacterium]
MFACRLCGHTQLKLQYEQGRERQFKFYRCPICRLVNYDLSGGTDQGKYAEEYPDPLDDDLKTNRLQTMTFRFLQRHSRQIPAGKLLDIGCGNGRLLYLCREGGWDVKGLELSPFLAESVTKRLKIDVKTADFMSYKPTEMGSFDLVILRHVLEHIPDSLHAMRSIRSLLKPGGHALMEFPNIDGIDFRMKRWMTRLGLSRKRYAEGYRPGHCNEFCKTSFEYLANRTGFRLKVWETYSNKESLNPYYGRIKIGGKARLIAEKIE